MPTVNVPDWLAPAALGPLARTVADRVLTLALVLGALFAYERLHGPVTPPTPTPPDAPAGKDDPTPPTPPAITPPLVLVAREYDATLGVTFASIGDRIAGGELATKDAIIGAVGEHSTPMGQTMAAAIDAACAANGSVSDKAGLGALFRQVGAALTTPGSK